MASNGSLGDVHSAGITAPDRTTAHSATSRIDATVVIPTRDRPNLLARCLSALVGQKTSREFEVVVVDDGGVGLPELADLISEHGVRVIDGRARGPAAARNRGISAARGDIVLFTDDDTMPEERWVEAAIQFLDRHPEHVGVTGPTISQSFDYLYQHSVDERRLGLWTCNIAYRREALERLGGFFEAFKSPHCEDLDLGYRAEELGPVGFVSEMRVVHPPRAVTLAQLVRRGRYARSELLLYARHPGRYRVPAAVPLRALPVLSIAARWSQRLRGEGLAILKTPRRLSRFVSAAVGEVALAVVSVATTRVPPSG